MTLAYLPIIFEIASAAALALWAALVIVGVAAWTKPSFWKALEKHLRRTADRWSLFLAAAATLGSLYLSNIANLTPCVLCWFQRIFMYPLVLVFALALYQRKSQRLLALWMTVIGGLVAIYHYALQHLAFLEASAPCDATASCASPYLNAFGFFTIPLLSLSVFAAIFALQFFFARKSNA